MPRLKPIPAGTRARVRVGLLLTERQRLQLYQIARAFPPSRGGRPAVGQAATLLVERGLGALEDEAAAGD